MAKITVAAKIDGGFHPGLGVEIKKGESYTMEEIQWGAALFERPSPDWKAPWEKGAQEIPIDEADFTPEQSELPSQPSKKKATTKNREFDTTIDKEEA